MRAFADRFLESGRAIDVIIDNAGIMAAPGTRVGRGREAQFATHHLGHFALVNRLWPAVPDGAWEGVQPYAIDMPSTPSRRPACGSCPRN